VKDILASSNEGVLSQLAWSNTLLAFDYDGTLAPIVDDPEAAKMRPKTRDVLERLARAYPCIVISGRSQRDALRRMRGTPVFEVIGNHGLEPWRRHQPFAARVAAWLPGLRRQLAFAKGVVIEDKEFSIAIHYRRAPSKKLARAAIWKAVADLPDVRVIGGKLVVNLIPQGAPHKGMALEMARESLQCDTALYVGDDETDEDVFALDDPGRLLSVRVGEKLTSRASFFIRDQESVDLLLGRLLALRQKARRHVATL
jgi:trehalose 6-phosphate phosphatase